jgi:hypothetical protein
MGLSLFDSLGKLHPLIDEMKSTLNESVHAIADTLNDGLNAEVNDTD